MSDSHSKKVRGRRMRRKRAHYRIRNRIQGTPERPRLSVFKSLHYIYAQVIDDRNGRTLAQANSTEAGLRRSLEASPSSCEAALAVGKILAERAKKEGVDQVVFDRGGFIYHGRVKAVAEGAREKGLVF